MFPELIAIGVVLFLGYCLIESILKAIEDHFKK